MDTRRHLVRRIFQTVAVVYVVILLAVAAFVGFDMLRPSDDPSFAGVWLILVNPFTMLLPPLGLSGMPALLVSVGIGLVLAAAVWSLGYLAPGPGPADDRRPPGDADQKAQ